MTRPALFWTARTRSCEPRGVRLALFPLSLMLLFGCVDSDPARASASLGASTEVALTSSAVPGPSPWPVAPDPVDRTHPAYGLALYHMTNVFEAPRKDARVLGYLRRGARFRASEEVGEREGCAKGWFEVLGGGFVCHGDGVLVDSQPPAAQDPPVLPALSDALPYRYMKTTTKDVPQYVRLPTPEEEAATLAAFASTPVVDPAVSALGALPPPISVLLRARMQPGFYVSIDREVRDEATGRVFLRTVRGGYIRAEQLVPAKLPKGLGVALGGNLKLPIAFVYRGGAPSLRLDPVRNELIKTGADLPLHGAHALTGEVVSRNGRRYYVTREGLYLRDTAVRIVDRVARPKHTGKSERWMRVDLDRQTLTAYEGDRPVFATLVSSGLSDHATPTGVYRLHAKHVATTMADNLAADGPYSIEDVPWTMYFLGSYALHAAFWHDRFGQPRSHGCVNLAPRDARWLFFWSEPDLPSGWHGSIARVGKGAVVALDSGGVYAIEQDG